jgi:hypothetical protein
MGANRHFSSQCHCLLVLMVAATALLMALSPLEDGSAFAARPLQQQKQTSLTQFVDSWGLRHQSWWSFQLLPGGLPSASCLQQNPWPGGHGMRFRCIGFITSTWTIVLNHVAITILQLHHAVVAIICCIIYKICIRTRPRELLADSAILVYCLLCLLAQPAQSAIHQPAILPSLPAALS